MPPQSAGILLFRRTGGIVQFLLVHPGGPFWAKKDAGAWSIPKGLYEEPENAVDAARREFWEETGVTITTDLVELGKFKQPGGKVISAWAAESDFDVAELRSNSFMLEWPPKSGKRKEFPEVDRAGWFSLTEAATKITKGQLPILMKLAAELGVDVSWGGV
ncbi:MAG TPA: NUDIX domain-containing protein [Roseiarcus sp.]|jgi:predicted NUDIX family NTP pyrophosphohydrolase